MEDVKRGSMMKDKAEINARQRCVGKLFYSNYLGEESANWSYPDSTRRGGSCGVGGSREEDESHDNRST